MYTRPLSLFALVTYQRLYAKWKHRRKTTLYLGNKYLILRNHKSSFWPSVCCEKECEPAHAGCSGAVLVDLCIIGAEWRGADAVRGHQHLGLLAGSLLHHHAKRCACQPASCYDHDPCCAHTSWHGCVPQCTQGACRQVGLVTCLLPPILTKANKG